MIQYTYAGQTYEKIIECEWDRGGIPEQGRLDVGFYDDSPEKLLYVSAHQDPYFRTVIDKLIRMVRTRA